MTPSWESLRLEHILLYFVDGLQCIKSPLLKKIFSHSHQTVTKAPKFTNIRGDRVLKNLPNIRDRWFPDSIGSLSYNRFTGGFCPLDTSVSFFDRYFIVTQGLLSRYINMFDVSIFDYNPN